MKGFETYP